MKPGQMNAEQGRLARTRKYMNLALTEARCFGEHVHEKIPTLSRNQKLLVILLDWH